MCIIGLHHWIIKDKISYYEILMGIKKERWWSDKQLDFKHDDVIVDRECSKCGKTDFNIQRIVSLIKKEFLTK